MSSNIPMIAEVPAIQQNLMTNGAVGVFQPSTACADVVLVLIGSILPELTIVVRLQMLRDLRHLCGLHFGANQFNKTLIRRSLFYPFLLFAFLVLQ